MTSAIHLNKEERAKHVLPSCLSVTLVLPWVCFHIVFGLLISHYEKHHAIRTSAAASQLTKPPVNRWLPVPHLGHPQDLQEPLRPGASLHPGDLPGLVGTEMTLTPRRSSGSSCLSQPAAAATTHPYNHC